MKAIVVIDMQEDYVKQYELDLLDRVNERIAQAERDHDLGTCLKNNKITERELLGVDGNSCVAISAVEGHKNGYTVILPCNYIGVKNKERFLQKKEQLRKSGIIIRE